MSHLWTVREKRPAFLLQGPAMLGMMLIGFVVYVGVMTAFTGVIQGSLVEVITEMPTIHVYDDSGERITQVTPEVEAEASPLLERRAELYGMVDTAMSTGDFGRILAAEEEIDSINAQLNDIGYHNNINRMLDLYWTFGIPAVAILVFFLVFSAAGRFWERGFDLWRRGASQEMLRNSILGIVVILLIPEIWDVFAINMERLALHMLNPEGDPEMVIGRLWCKMGASAGCMYDFAEVLDPLNWSTVLTDPDDFGQSLLADVLLPFFKLTPAFVASLAIFIAAKVRVLFISIVLITIPVWFVLKNVPYVGRTATDMIENMVGASLAPFLSALTLYVGWVYVSETSIPSLEEWVVILGIVTLAGLWPVILAPFIGRVISTVQGAVQTGVSQTSMMSMQMGMGAAAGALAGATRSGLGGGMTGLGAGTAAGMLGSIPEIKREMGVIPDVSSAITKKKKEEKKEEEKRDPPAGVL